MAILSKLFLEKTAQCPDKTAIWCDGKTISYTALARLVRRYCDCLAGNGVAFGDHVGFPMSNSIESVAMIFAAAHMGVALVPISPTLPFAAMKRVFDVGNVKHIVAREAFYESEGARLGEFGFARGGAMFCIDGEYEGCITLNGAEGDTGDTGGGGVRDSEGAGSTATVTGDETLIVCFTSGSTGSPKAISLTQNDKYRRAIAHINLYGITENDNVLAATPLYHTLAERLAIMPLILGGTLVLLPRFTPNIWMNCVQEQKVTFTIAVSAQLSQVASMLSSPFSPMLSSLRCVVSSSALLEPHIRNELIQGLKCDFHEMYGASEISTATNIHFQRNPEKQRSVGYPLPEAEIRIKTQDGRNAEPLEIGEIQCKTSLICNDYYGMGELFDAQMDDRYFKTGDLGYLDEDGFLYFSGRIKEMIITGGINVYPQDIEQCVLEIPDINECAAFAYPDERLVEVVALAVTLKPNCKLTKRAIQVQCARNLADFQQPHRIYVLNELPKNAMGKVMKNCLLKHIQLMGME